MTKKIIQRNLPLDTKYNLIDKKYTSLIDSVGICCHNCNKLISNIATVKSEAGNVYMIGFDCLETILINNNLLDGKSIEDYNEYKKQLPTILKRSKEIAETISEHNRTKIVKIVALDFELENFYMFKCYGKNGFIYFDWIFENGKKQNDYIKIPNATNLDILFSTLSSVSNVQITKH